MLLHAARRGVNLRAATRWLLPCPAAHAVTVDAATTAAACRRHFATASSGGKACLVVGGGGALGRATVQKFAESGWECTSLDFMPNEHAKWLVLLQQGEEFAESSRRVLEELQIAQPAGFNAIVHAGGGWAGSDPGDEAFPESLEFLWDVNVKSAALAAHIAGSMLRRGGNLTLTGNSLVHSKQTMCEFPTHPSFILELACHVRCSCRRTFSWCRWYAWYVRVRHDQSRHESLDGESGGRWVNLYITELRHCCTRHCFACHCIMFSLTVHCMLSGGNFGGSIHTILPKTIATPANLAAMPDAATDEWCAITTNQLARNWPAKLACRQYIVCCQSFGKN